MEPLAEARPRDSGVVFSGTVEEYFRIWIVNTALTIVTLGIYSPWAKVRKYRYFYGNTSIEGGHFDYHAKPKAILIGRLIAVAFLGAYYLSTQYAPLVGLGIILFVVLIIPWLAVRTQLFQLRNTSYQGLRFNFQRNYKGSFKAFYGGFLITLVTLGLGAPTAIYMRNKFVAENAGFGTTQFTWTGEQGEFYAIFWKSVGFILVGAVLFSLVVIPATTAFVPAADVTGNGTESSAMIELISMLITLPLFLLYAAVGVYVQVRQKNYVWNRLYLKQNSFMSTLSVRKMFWIYLSNLAAIVVSIGLLTPWAQIRLARYRAESMLLYIHDDWSDYKASRDSEGSALGEEIGEAFDVEIDVAF